MSIAFMKHNMDNVYLNDILKNIGYVKDDIEGFSEVRFSSDRKTQYSVLHSIQIIGEAVKRLSAEVKDKMPSIPWKDIAGTRDYIVHDYEGVDYSLVWDVAVNKLDNLENVISDYLSRDR